MTRKRNILKGRLYEYGYNYQDLADYLGMSLSYTSQRVNGCKDWKVTDLKKIGKLLDIDDSDLMKYVI